MIFYLGHTRRQKFGSEVLKHCLSYYQLVGKTELELQVSTYLAYLSKYSWNGYIQSFCSSQLTSPVTMKVHSGHLLAPAAIFSRTQDPNCSFRCSPTVLVAVPTEYYVVLTKLVHWYKLLLNSLLTKKHFFYSVI